MMLGRPHFVPSASRIFRVALARIGLTPKGGRDITEVLLERRSQNMKRSRFSEEQIIGILREAEAGSPVKAVCAAHNISTATYHAWKRKFGGLEVSEAKRLRALEEENSRLKRLVADQAVQIHILKEVNAKKW